MRDGRERPLGHQTGTAPDRGSSGRRGSALRRRLRGARPGITYFTVYAFSTENWRRPHEEVRFLLNVIADNLLTRRRDELHRMGVKIRFIGRRDWRVPRWIVKRMDEATALTSRNQAMTLTVAFNYGGRAELVDAVKAVVASGVPARKVDERTIHRHLYAPDVPDPDLVIRTSGEFRVSNFLLWELAYSELVFTDVLWPDFRREHLSKRSGSSRLGIGATGRPAVAKTGSRTRRRCGLYRDEGIVLRTHKLGEADRIVVLFTAGRGKVRAVAKGVRKTKSRFGGRLEPPNRVSLLLYEGRELDVVTQAETVEYHPALRDDLDRLTDAIAMIEAVDQVDPGGRTQRRPVPDAGRGAADPGPGTISVRRCWWRPSIGSSWPSKGWRRCWTAVFGAGPAPPTTLVSFRPGRGRGAVPGAPPRSGARAGRPGSDSAHPRGRPGRGAARAGRAGPARRRAGWPRRRSRLTSSAGCGPSTSWAGRLMGQG